MSKLFSISDFDLSKKCEEGFEFEILDDSTGKGTGAFLTVVGGHAARVQSAVHKALNARRIEDDMNEKRGKKARVRTVEDDIEFSTEMVAARVIAWRPFEQECTKENVMQLCKVNPLVKEQILKASEDIANFTKASTTN